jgi:hypothetical protein
MADRPRGPATEDNSGRGPDSGPAKARPGWLFLLGIIIAIALVGLMVFLHLTGTLGPGTH